VFFNDYWRKGGKKLKKSAENGVGKFYSYLARGFTTEITEVTEKGRRMRWGQVFHFAGQV